MQKKVHLGIDISKDKLDFHCANVQESFVVTNNKKGLDKFKDWAKQHKFDLKSMAICFEHTGSYGKLLEHYCIDNDITYYKVPALEIKLSSGIIRGKNDAIDAKRICEYLIEKEHKLIPTKPDIPDIERLKLLNSQRKFLVKQRASQFANLKNYSEVLLLKKEDIIVTTCLDLIGTFKLKISSIEAEIEKIISLNKTISKNYNLILSIVGVGPIIALNTIIQTNNFENFKTWRQFASYCGSAPFSNESGKLIKNKRIHSLANKELKAYLTSGAKSAIRHDPELKEYYNRKLSQGKSFKCIINIIRCKLISRMFSVIKNNAEYKKNYTHFLEVSLS